MLSIFFLICIIIGFQGLVAESALSLSGVSFVEERVPHVPCEGVWLALLQALIVGPSAVRLVPDHKNWWRFQARLLR